MTKELARAMQTGRLLERSVRNTLFFILGFTLLFVLLGAGAGSLSRFLHRHTRLITVAGGAVIVLLALQVMGVVNIPFLNYERKTQVRRKPRGAAGAFIVGVTFAAAWTPCIGPILSSILILAATGSSLRGMLLLAVYSLGLGIPFLFAVVAFGSFLSFSDFMKRHFRTVKLASGLLLLAVGLALVLGQFQQLSRYLAFVPDVTLIESSRVTALVALAAGFISFISPCVLPLIPSYLAFITGDSVMEARPG
ncbi:MAG: cytochrome c biogenesis protein CcdA [Spirochaetota bacterium]